MKAHGRWTIRLAVIFLVLSAVGCGRSEAPQTSRPSPTPTSLRLKWVFDPGFGGEMVAAKKGFFEENGLKVDLRPGGFEADPVRMVAAGTDGFGVAGADSFLLGRSKGIPIVAFAAGYLETPVVFYVHPDAMIDGPKDFAHKRVGYQAGQDTGTVYEAMLRVNGVDRKSVREVPAKFDFSPFLSKQVDVWPGYAASQSYVLEQRHIPYQTIVPSKFGVNYMGTVYFTTEKMLREQPKLVEGFARALVKGWNFVYSHEDEAVSLIGEYDKATLTPEMVRFTLDRQKSQLRPQGTDFCVFTDKMWQSTAGVLKDQGLLDKQFSLQGAYVTSFLGK